MKHLNLVFMKRKKNLSTAYKYIAHALTCKNAQYFYWLAMFEFFFRKIGQSPIALHHDCALWNPAIIQNILFNSFY